MGPAYTWRSFFGRTQANSKRVKRALASDPNSPVALNNLGAIFGKEGDSLKALYYQATVLRDRSPGPADRIRPCLRLQPKLRDFNNHEGQIR